MTTDPAAPPSRQERRKAETRRRIVTAADALFQERGYTDTSIEDIAGAADVAVRTIYLHFESKAAIMLTYFDDWLDAFVAAVLARPVDEPVVQTAREATATMAQAGWLDRVEGGDARPHPLVEYLGSGPLELAGHVTHRWMEAVDVLARDATERSAESTDPIDPHARAMAFHTFWFSAMTAARRRSQGAPLPADANGERILTRLTSGEL